MQSSNNNPEAEFAAALKAARRNRKDIEQSEVCGCYHCQSIFPPTMILEWISPDRKGVGQTAVCPKCGNDCVIGSKAGFPLTATFLQELSLYWFFEEK